MNTLLLASAPRFRSLKALGRRGTTTDARPVLAGIAAVAALATFGATPALAGRGPVVTTDQATGVTVSSAILHGSVNLRGVSGSYYFRWGTTSNDEKGRTAATSLSASSSAQAAVTTLTGLDASTTYHVRLVATTNSGAQSRGADVTFRTPSASDAQAPTAPGMLGTTGSTQTSISLSWSASSDDRGVTGYEVLQSGTVVKTVTDTNATVDGLTPATSYSFTVRAFDAAGNRSAESAPLSANTVTPPPAQTVPTVSTDQASDVSTTRARPCTAPRT